MIKFLYQIIAVPRSEPSEWFYRNVTANERVQRAAIVFLAILCILVAILGTLVVIKRLQ